MKNLITFITTQLATFHFQMMRLYFSVYFAIFKTPLKTLISNKNKVFFLNAKIRTYID